MTPITSIGEFVLSVGSSDYILKPSFEHISLIGTPAEIVQCYGTLNGLGIDYDSIQSITDFASSQKRFPPNGVFAQAMASGTYTKEMTRAAALVIMCCCYDDCSDLVGEYVDVGGRVEFRRGIMPELEMIHTARNLMEHGIIGKVKLRKLQKNEGKNEFTKEFHCAEYISAARVHFSMSRQEAGDLTMTEFMELMKIKFPDSAKGFTREEYDNLMDDYDKRRAARLNKNGR